MSGIPLSEFWEKDDGVRMDGLIRIERFIISQGTNSAQIWSAWYDVKQLAKAALKYSGAPAEQQTTAPCCSVEDSHISETETSHSTPIMPACPMCYSNTWVVSVGSGYQCNICHEHWPVKPATASHEVRDCDTCAHDGECYVTVLKCKGYHREGK